MLSTLNKVVIIIIIIIIIITSIKLPVHASDQQCLKLALEYRHKIGLTRDFSSIILQRRNLSFRLHTFYNSPKVR